MAASGADQRLYGLQGNLNGKIAEEFPELTEGGVVSNSYPNIEGPMWEDYRASLEEYDAPDLDWNSLAGLGTWTAYTAFKNVVEGMSGDITNETFLDAINATTALDTDGMIGELDLTKPYTASGRAAADLQPHGVLRHHQGREAHRHGRQGLRHDRAHRRSADVGVTFSPPPVRPRAHRRRACMSVT